MKANDPQRQPSAEDRMPPMPGRRGGPGAGFQAPVERARNATGTVLRLWGYLRRERLALILTGLLVAGSVAFDLAGPLLLGRVIDRHIVPRELDGLARTLGLMLLVYALSAASGFLQAWIMAGASQRTLRALRIDLFDRLQRLPLRFFDRRAHGELMARVTNDVESINQVLGNSVTQLVSGALSTVGVAVAMVLINPWLALASVFFISLFTVTANRWLGARIRARYRVQQAALGRLYGFIEESVGGRKLVKACGQEAAIVARFDDINQASLRAGVQAQTFSGVTGPLMNMGNNLGLAIVAVLGGFMAIRGLATVGTIATFINYTRQFGRPLNEIANLYNQIQSAMAGAERVFEIIDEPPEADTPGAQPLGPVRGDIVFEDVHFSYREGVPVLKAIDLHARPGQTIALIGPTGAGKTTIINLLTRFYEIDRGRVLLDGRDLRDIAKDDLRRHLGIVLQDTFLFSGTVRDNIRYGRLDATDAEVEEAARLANADPWIRRLPQGYDTLLTGGGGSLSHGQRQMLSIARAILADPSILILDEATSSVDTRTEKHIQEAMARLMRNRTSFVIAHRLSTIRNADQIIVINHGEIQERGTHAELIAQKGFYWRLSGSPEPSAAVDRSTAAG
ncbi:ABC-type multidrug transport system, ATPase and permease component [Opitutaceae bacterium TAV1]|nr:ABC-type multidrug transport system, ATPase and permease component [Opitutaceae bacterium TAV1]